MMNSAHLHLVLNHIPVIGSAIAIFVLILGMLKKSDDVKKVGAMILLLTALITIPVYLSGKSSEAKIEGNYEDVDEEFIEAHEEFALNSFIVMDIAGAIALFALVFYRKPKIFPNYISYLILFLLIISNGMMAYTANLGGKIHHPEIREDRMPWEEAPSVNDNDDNVDKKDNSGKKEKDEDEK
ncbi:MAG: hypothetical protein ABIY50_07640 [Ignavibacteria bacterium]